MDGNVGWTMVKSKPTSGLSKRGNKMRVIGIGGIFFKAKRPALLANWYREHLGINITDNVALFTWLSPVDPKRKGHTVWALFSNKSRYFRDSRARFMVNYRVKSLRQILTKLRKEGIRVEDQIRNSKYGKFCWVIDPEGNPIELWEPPKRYKAPEEEMPSQ